MLRRLPGMLLLLLLAPSAALAQTGKHVALGVSLGVSKYNDKAFDSSNLEVSPAYRLRLKTSHQDGWGWSLKGAPGYSRKSTSADIAGSRTKLGKLQTITLMVGGQRVYRRGPLEVGMGVVAGPAFHHFDVDAAARDAYQNDLGVQLQDVKVKTSLAVRPEIGAWYDLSEWFAVGASVSYLFDRPKAEVRADGTTNSSTWTADHTSASVHVVVGIF